LYFCNINGAANAGRTLGFGALTRSSMHRFRGLLSDGLFGTLWRHLLAHFVRCVTGRAAQDGASEDMVGEMAGDIGGN
jgi:hypothetical protein